jgi:branched-chain amino acid transport system ATP-binding protein
MASATPLLELDRLCKAYGSLKVSDELSLVIEEGETHALIGPNGAGKTSLIGQISGAIAPDSGRILFDGADITGLAMAARTRLGLARSFQVTNLLPELTALDNVALAVQARLGHSFRFLRRAAGDPELDGPARAALEQVGLGPRGEVPVSALSHGEKRLLEIAVALATGPRLMLLDEPMAGIGHDEAAALTQTLAALRGRVTMLLVEHDMATVFALADRISVLVVGRIVATGAPAAIRDDEAVKRAYLGEEAVAC